MEKDGGTKGARKVYGLKSIERAKEAEVSILI
jgi:hypothetical protein